MSTALSRSTNRRTPVAFTLLELLIVMGVIAALSVLTLVSVSAITKDARMASATNAVVASLDNARSLAMKNNRIVLVVFRARLDGSDGVVVDIVPCEWTGESYRNGIGATSIQVIDRFMPIPAAPVRTLPRGIKVAAPFYARGDDAVWATQSHLPATAAFNEVAGVIFGVMYGPDGTTISSNAQSDSDLSWVDFNFDPTVGRPFIRNGGVDFLPGDNMGTPPPIADLSDRTFYEQNFNDDEPFVVIAPFLAVYDDDEARELKTGEWAPDDPPLVYQRDLVGDPAAPDLYPGYISENATRIHFNRYTGVVMK